MKGLITGLQHIGIPTDKFEETQEFYAGLGFKPIYKVYSKLGGHWVSFMGLGNVVMEFYEVAGPVKRDGAIDHISLDCNDIEAVYKRALERKDIILSNGIEGRDFGEKGVRYIIIEGPNKERIEINQDLNEGLLNF